MRRSTMKCTTSSLYTSFEESSNLQKYVYHNKPFKCHTSSIAIPLESLYIDTLTYIMVSKAQPFYIPFSPNFKWLSCKSLLGNGLQKFEITCSLKSLKSKHNIIYVIKLLFYCGAFNTDEVISKVPEQKLFRDTRFKSISPSKLKIYPVSNDLKPSKLF